MKGYRWKVGNGKYISISKGPWINNDESSIPISIKDNLKGLKVSCIIDERNRWMEDKIKENFSQHEAEDILRMPLASEESKDEIIWKYDKRGTFSVKSAY